MARWMKQSRVEDRTLRCPAHPEKTERRLTPATVTVVIILLAVIVACLPPRHPGPEPSRNEAGAATAADTVRDHPSDNRQPALVVIEKKRFLDLAQLQGSGHDTTTLPRNNVETVMPGDQLEITLYEKLPVSQEKRIELKRVDDNGAVFIYPLGNLPLAGMAIDDARSVVERRMEAFIISPFCEISIIKKAYEPRVFVFGEAVRLGAFPFKNGDRLLDVLSLAGGTTQSAYAGSIKIVRLYGDSVGVMSIDLMSIIKRGRVESNIEMQDQDIVYIPKNLLQGATELLTKLGTVIPWYYFVKNF